MKKGCLKILSLTIFTIILGFVFTNKAYAANASMTIKTNNSTIAVGGTFTATVTVYSSAGIGAWEYNLNYDSSKLTLISNNVATHIADYASGQGKTTASYTYTFKAKSTGSASLSVSSYSAVDWNEKQLSINVQNASVKVLTQAEIEASYSKNNYLKSLSVDGYTLSPEFNKDTLEYSVELEPETKSIKVNAAKEDSKATLTGTGDIEVSEGENTINVVVTAQNGTVRTYIIKATVKELSPIEVTINKEKLTVVRKKEALTIPEFYNETTIKIGEEEVPAFKSDVTKLTLVGLKNDKGEISLYIYNEKKNEYTPYIQISSNKIVLYQTELDKGITIPENYKKYKIKIDDVEFECYKIFKNSKFALIYGMNVETGKKNWYTYNEDEKTIQIYNDDEINALKEKIDSYFTIILIFGVLSGLLAIVLLIMCIKKLSNKNKIKLNKSKMI